MQEHLERVVAGSAEVQDQEEHQHLESLPPDPQSPANRLDSSRKAQQMECHVQVQE